MNPLSTAFLCITLSTLIVGCKPDQSSPAPQTESHASAQPSEQYQAASCLAQFHQNIPPIANKTALAKHTYPICHNDFAVLYSGDTRTSLWVAQKLTKTRLSQSLKREDSFKEYTQNIPENQQAKLKDYRGSGYDRGHMAPNADMGNKASQSDSFYLTNMVPQTPDSNQRDWREIEEAVRKLVKTMQRDTYVITGPAFITNKKNPAKFIPCDKIDRNDKNERAAKECASNQKNRIQVPTHTYKAVYFSSPKGTPFISAYWVENDRDPIVKVISICELERKIGINLFPELDEATKRLVYDLPLNAASVNKQPPKQIGSYNKGTCLAANDVQKQTVQQQFKDYS